MYSRKLLAALAATTLALTFSACGDDEEEPAATPSDTPAVTAEEPATTTEASTDEAPVTIPEDVRDAAVESCLEQAASAPNLDDETRADIEEICESAASGDIQDASDAAREICRETVEANVPEGDARDQALETCESLGG